MLLRRTTSYCDLFCFIADVYGSEAFLCSQIMLIDYEQIIFYYIMYKYTYVWYLFINKQHSGIHEYIHVRSLLHTNIKELTDSQTNNPLYVLYI
jgi:hypothetical protein